MAHKCWRRNSCLVVRSVGQLEGHVTPELHGFPPARDEARVTLFVWAVTSYTVWDSLGVCGRGGKGIQITQVYLITAFHPLHPPPTSHLE